MYNVIINKNINRVLGNLQHSAGTYDMYDCELKELLDMVLFTAPEAGYSNARVGELARVIVMLQNDLKILAARDKASINATLNNCFEAIEEVEKIIEDYRNIEDIEPKEEATESTEEV